MNNKPIKRQSAEPTVFDLFSDNGLAGDFFSRFFREFESRVPSIFGGTGQLLKGVGREHPRVDLSEDENNIYLDAAVPGWGKDEIKINVEDDILTLTGAHKEEQQVKDETRKYIEQRIAHRNFYRTFTLPNVDFERIDAELKDGILHVTIPKLQPDKPKSIDVEIK